MKTDGYCHLTYLTKMSFFIRVNRQRGNSSVVERDLAKVDVAGPTPVSRFSRISQVFLIHLYKEGFK